MPRRREREPEDDAAWEPVPDGTCALCDLAFLPYGLRGVIPRCGHTFHFKCIDSWRGEMLEDKCPTCIPTHVFDVIEVRYPPQMRRNKAQKERERDIEYEPVSQYCAVCEALVGPESIPRGMINSTCNHVFCFRCITMWATTQNNRRLQITCPMCRAPFNDEVRAEFPENRRRTRTMAVMEAEPLIIVDPDSPPRSPSRSPSPRSPFPPRRFRSPPRYIAPFVGRVEEGEQFNPLIPEPPDPFTETESWNAWVAEYGRNTWHDWQLFHPFCVVCRLDIEHLENPFVRCQMCGFFWHNGCDAPEDGLGTPEFHETHDGEHVWLCLECRDRPLP